MWPIVTRDLAGFAASLLLAIWGVVLLKRFSVYRTGKDVYCGRCDYDLRGITGERCPECGTVLKGNRALGRRARDYRLALLGVFFLISAASMFTLALRRCDAYAFMSTRQLIRHLSNRLVAPGAWHQLQRREGRWSSADRKALYDAAAGILGTGSPIEGELREYLAHALVSGDLSDRDVGQLCRSLLSVEVRLDPSSDESGQIIQIVAQLRNPLYRGGAQGESISAIISCIILSIDGESQRSLIGQSESVSLGDAEVSRWAYSTDYAGDTRRNHVISVDMNAQVYVKRRDGSQCECYRGRVSAQTQGRKREHH
jgi:hypothetical protein